MSRSLVLAFAVVCANTTALAQEATDAVAPEDASPESVPAAFAGLSDRATASLAAKASGQPVKAEEWMVVAANPLAVQAGARVLREGGTAADAMVAVQAVLGLVEPQSSGLGGGAFLVWYDAESGEVTTLDGRETAPLAATPLLFQTPDGTSMEFWDAVVGGRSVGTPGVPALMAEAHRLWGQSNWPGLFTEAIDLAEEGFIVSPRLAHLVSLDAERLRRFPATEAYLFPDGEAIEAGDLLKNPAYAETLHLLSTQGSQIFYQGALAEEIVATVRGVEGNPGVLSLADFDLYNVVRRPAVCATYNGANVCGMGPPSSGGLAVGQILGILDQVDLGDPSEADTWRLIGDAARLAFADRARYVADSDFVPVPAAGLVDPSYLESRSALLSGSIALETVEPGDPEWDHAMLWADNVSIALPSTSHISIVDAFGNALSMTTTIENGFGSRLMVRGFFLNNELTDFSFDTHRDGVPIANRVEPGKRPRSSMAPTIVLRDGEPILVIGSPGGSRIIGYVAQAIIAHLHWGMDIQSAVAMPHLINRFGPFDLEEGTTAV
ncbi:MAG: gamma-glutamyltransferase, partial [Pseudomonadota bacterium]